MTGGLLDDAAGMLRAVTTSPVEWLALVAVIAGGLFVISGSFVKTMIPLRWLAIGSSLGFVVYGALHPSYPMLLLHGVLLPLHLYRLVEMKRLIRKVNAALTDGTLSGVWLRPYMRTSRKPAGTVLFRKGDRGDRLYLLADGGIDLVEVDSQVRPGEIFGEIAFFAPDRRRRLTARCRVDSTVLSIDESTLRQLYFQNPAFGFRMIELVAGRLSADVDRLNAEVQAMRAGSPSPSLPRSRSRFRSRSSSSSSVHSNTSAQADARVDAASANAAAVAPRDDQLA